VNKKNELVQKALTLGLSSYNNADFPQATLLLKKVLQLDPENFYALHFLGIILIRENNFKIAHLLLAKAVLLKPKDGDVNHHLGLALKGLGQNQKASEYFSRAIKVKPDFAVAHLGYADVMTELGHIEKATSAYQKALQYDSSLIKAHNNLGAIYRKQSELLKAIASYQAAFDLDKSRLDILSNVLMGIATEPTISPEQYILKAKEYGRASTEKATAYTEWPKLESSPAKIRVGLVSGDLRKHSVAYFLKSWLGKLDSNRVELLAYSNHSVEDEVSEELKSYFYKWNPISNKLDKEVAQMIVDDQVNILIDLSGHTAYNRLPLFSWKPAPIQVSWMGFFASTGVAEIDYFIGDQWNFPESIIPYYVEKPWRLNTSGCFSPPNTGSDVGELPALKNGYITFGCFHKIAKLNDDVVELWSKILLQNESSKLLIKDTAFSDETVQRNVEKRFSKFGIDKNRIECEKGESREQYFDSYKRIDIGLDPFPFNGGTVSLESLWMGVPYISLFGDDRISRRGGAVLYKAGLDQFVATTQDEYINIANRVCADIDSLSETRKSLRETVSESKLYNGTLMARDLENAFENMWLQYLKAETV
jgi:predicted O-linked N-acetylglucosamine transferase (SPINDLY family)